MPTSYDQFLTDFVAPVILDAADQAIAGVARITPGGVFHWNPRPKPCDYCDRQVSGEVCKNCGARP